MLGRLDSPFHFWDKDRPIYTHLRHLPGSLIPNVHVRDSLISEGLLSGRLRRRQLGRRRAHAPCAKAHAISRSVLLGADFYEYGGPPDGVPGLGIGKDVVLDRVIIDKNARIGDGARLVNEQQRRARRRRRLLHPQRHHRGAEGRRDQARTLSNSQSNSQRPTTPNAQSQLNAIGSWELGVVGSWELGLGIDRYRSSARAQGIGGRSGIRSN